MNKSIFCAILLLATWFHSPLFPENKVDPDLLTIAESSGFTRTSLYRDVISLVHRFQIRSERVRLIRIATSTEGRPIPMVVVSREGVSTPAEMRMTGKSAVLINANIHAGEVEGKEASLMLIRDLILDPLPDVLDHQILLVIPIFNPDGNEKLGKNRGDKGPELAGIRANGQNLDLNRDFLKLESPEVRGLVSVLREWDPVLFLDLHTTNGSYHREPVTFTTLSNPNTDPVLRDYMWNQFFPAVQKILKAEYDVDSVPYGNFVDRKNPEKGWRNHAFEALYSTNYVGLRNRFSILDENYSHADFRTRVHGCHAFLRSVIRHSDTHMKEMKALTREADMRAAQKYRKTDFILDYEVVRLFDFTLKSYQFKIEKIPPEERHRYPPWIGDALVKPMEKHRDYSLTYYAATKPTRVQSLPDGYILPATLPETAALLKRHGLVVEILQASVKMDVEVFDLSEITNLPRLYQGHLPMKLKGKYRRETRLVEQGAYWIAMDQPLSRLLAELLEPEASHGLVQWGHFNRVIQRQWSRKPGQYPVLRVPSGTPRPALMAN